MEKLNGAAIAASDWRELREWVDEWLATGRVADGSEDPRGRHLSDASLAGRAVRALTYRHMALFLVGDHLAAFVPTDKEQAKVMAGVYDTPVDPRQPWKTAVFFGATQLSAAHFTLFMLSPFRFQLARCVRPECARYFMLGQWNRMYPKGTLCNDCKRDRSLQSATDATVESRSEARKALCKSLIPLRDRILSNPEWFTDPALKPDMLTCLNKEWAATPTLSAHYPKPLTTKWFGHKPNQQGVREALATSPLDDLHLSKSKGGNKRPKPHSPAKPPR